MNKSTKKWDLDKIKIKYKEMLLMYKIMYYYNIQ